MVMAVRVLLLLSLLAASLLAAPLVLDEEDDRSGILSEDGELLELDDPAALLDVASEAALPCAQRMCERLGYSYSDFKNRLTADSCSFSEQLKCLLYISWGTCAADILVDMRRSAINARCHDTFRTFMCQGWQFTQFSSWTLCLYLNVGWSDTYFRSWLMGDFSEVDSDELEARSEVLDVSLSQDASSMLGAGPSCEAYFRCPTGDC
eukprot:JP446844.1.p1 GENE.JP446844.1~~JP446844.1.p1  ORF type:complete len:207 (-),score=29.85 JP446844.1:175-795(-)